MKLLNIFIFAFFCAFSFSSACLAECADTPFLTEITWEDVSESEDGEVFLEINDVWHPIDALHYEDGYYYLQTGHSPQGDPSEVIFKCPCCWRLQTLALLQKNKMHCSHCKQNVYTCSRPRDFDGSPY